MNCECPDCGAGLEAKAVCWTWDDAGGDEEALSRYDEAMAYDMSDPDTAQELGWFPTCMECLQNFLAEGGVGDDAMTWKIEDVNYWRKPMVNIFDNMATKPTVRVPAEVGGGCHSAGCGSHGTPRYWAIDEPQADNSNQNTLNGTTLADSLEFMTNAEVVTDLDATDFGWMPMCETCFRYWYLGEGVADYDSPYKASDINVKWWAYKYVVHEATG